MSVSVEIDDKEVFKAFRDGVLTIGDILDVEKPIALTIVNSQKRDVPVDTAATKTSIRPHIQRATTDEVIDHIGPETEYAEYIEFGVISKPNYPIQPFVRPSVFGNEQNIKNVANAAFKALIKKIWPS